MEKLEIMLNLRESFVNNGTNNDFNLRKVNFITATLLNSPLLIRLIGLCTPTLWQKVSV